MEKRCKNKARMTRNHSADPLLSSNIEKYARGHVKLQKITSCDIIRVCTTVQVTC